MKTGKVTRIEKARQWSNANGTFDSYSVEFDNGDSGEVSVKAGKPAPWEVGATAEYDVTPGGQKQDGGKWPDRIKKAFKGGGGGGGFRGRTPEQEKQNQRLILWQNSCTQAREWIAHAPVADEEYKKGYNHETLLALTKKIADTGWKWAQEGGAS